MKGAIFTYVLTCFGAVGGVVNPFVGLLVYICFAIVRPEFMWPWAVGAEGRYSFIVGLSLLAGWALRGFGRWNFGRAAPIVLAMAGYWLWMVFAAFLARDPERAWAQVELFAKIFLPVLVGMTTVSSMAQVRQLVWVILLSQTYVAFEMHLYYYGGYNKAAEEGFGGMDNNCLAIAMVTGVGLAFFLGMGARELWKKALAFGSAALMAHVIMFSFSRGGMLALALTGVMSFFLIPKKPWHYMVFVAAILLAVRLAGPQVRERLMTAFAKTEAGQREASAQSRIDIWGAALDAALRRPLAGIGPDNWKELALEYGFQRKEVHSLWVQNAAEMGFPGLLLLASFFGVCMARLWPIAREYEKVDDPFKCDVARMVFASLFGFVIAAQFVTIKYLEVPYYIALAGAAMLMMTPKPVLQFRPQYGRSVRQRLTNEESSPNGLTRPS